ncbi:DNA cytosine methyltransferase [Spiroplasma cantharicola]|uniref:Cytosine-specific methyltransferase n=1 Tax=Spiroplasma cantharicola TaxID=362837 RepID=A0A0M4JIV1_9MOLU|nr:DNA cytosine methyltransferase [Spiroplasma cantharicola]ALD66603.1 DNA (cytosine-5)-methyltransferase 1 [Spiroplasma cantharicola]
MENFFLTIKDVALKENKSIKTIRRLIAANKIKVSKNQGKLNQIHHNDYLEWKKTKDKFEINEPNQLTINQDIKMDDFEMLDIERDFNKRDGWKHKYRNGYKFIDLFSGAGGLSCGLVMAGFEPISSVEIVETAVSTYEYNFSKKFPNEKLENRDIRDSKVKKEVIDFGLKNDVDVIVGGFPCQGFSLAGNRIFVDERNSLYTDMLKIVKEIKPKIVVMENVEGLRSMLDGKIELKIIKDYQDIGYKISAHTLNSADYGVAQRRKRVIFIANRLGKKNAFPKPIFKKENYKTLGEEIERFINVPEDQTINHIFTKHSEDMKRKLSLLEEGKSLYKNYSDSWKKSPWNEPSCTIKENHGGVNIHPKLPRVLTPRELAAIQSFPDDFIFSGNKSAQLVQIGNAVPPKMSKAIGLVIEKLLENNK